MRVSQHFEIRDVRAAWCLWTSHCDGAGETPGPRWCRGHGAGRRDQGVAPRAAPVPPRAQPGKPSQCKTMRRTERSTHDRRP